ncbi:MAG: response regulator transcription factor [Limnochordaceae bacterium]|nr:response regulator transcription factor [Limnochordaceae bacterium]
MLSTGGAGRLLVADDEPDVVDLVRIFFEQQGWQVDGAGDGRSALEKARSRPYDAILLDVAMPGMDGMALCRELREAGVDVPILMLTARDADADKLRGFGAGADDYVTKPFSPVELVARVGAHVRRYRRFREQGRHALRFAGLVIDPAARQVWKDGQEVALTPREFDLLLFLARHPHQVFTREQLFEAVWGERYLEADSNTVTVHIRRLRSRLGDDPSGGAIIRTVWGVGYRFEPPGGAGRS